MASKTAGESLSKERLYMDSLPLVEVDLRVLSQTELYSLSRCSSYSTVFHLNNNGDDVLIPKIDRSVFNESAGSRKQTYSRLRFSTRKPQFPSTSTPSHVNVPGQGLESLDEESVQIVALFKELFAAESCDDEKDDNYNSNEDEDLVPIRIDYVRNESVPDKTNGVFQNIPGLTVDISDLERKRKRGRPPKNGNPFHHRISKAVVLNENVSGKHVEKVNDMETETTIINENRDVVGGGDLQRKRKRGRPRKIDNQYHPINSNAADENASRKHVHKVNDMEKVVLNENIGGKHVEKINDMETGMINVNENGDVVGGSDLQRKRKRGRPRKNDQQYHPRISNVANGTASGKHVHKVNDMEMELALECDNGDVVDLAALGNVEDPFGEELRKRTEGMETEAELLEFLRRLDGDWGSWREKRKIVRASIFGTMLPRGWKLMLSVKRKRGRVWLNCRKYISPHGRQFVSCKEVSSYLLSLYGPKYSKQHESGLIEDGLQVVSVTLSGNKNADPTSKDDRSAVDLISCSPLLFTSLKDDCDKQAVYVDARNSRDFQREEILQCLQCTMGSKENTGFAAPLSISQHDCKSL